MFPIGLNNAYFTLKVNTCCYTFYDGSQGPTLPNNMYHLRSLLRHEFGHALGLCHSSTDGFLMDETLPPGIVRNVDTDAINGSKYYYDSSYTGVLPESGANPVAVPGQGQSVVEPMTIEQIMFHTEDNLIIGYKLLRPTLSGIQ